MTQAEAQRLWTRLVDAYPAATFTEGTARQYMGEFRPLSFELASAAVDGAIHASRFLPSIAELHQQYVIVREQRERERAAERVRQERLAEDSLPRPALGEIPAVAEYLARLHSVDERLHLEEVAAGKCDDCKREGRRYKFVRLALCSGCAVSRFRVKAQVDAA